MTYDRLIEIQSYLVNEWGDNGKRVVEACWSKVNPMPMKEFLSYCSCCGGNWGGMFLTGIKKLNPEVWDAIPNDMGVHAFVCLCMVLELMGVDPN